MLLELQTSSEKQDNSTSENLFKVHVLDDAPFSIIEKDDVFKIAINVMKFIALEVIPFARCILDIIKDVKKNEKLENK